MAAVKRLLLYPPAHCPQKSKNATLWVHLHQCPIASHHIPPQSAAAILTAAFPSTDPRRQQKYRLINSRNLKKRAPEIFSQAPLLFMSYYNTLFLLCQLFSLFFICSYFVLFFRFFFYRFLVVIPWLLFFGFYSLAFIPLLLFPYFILWLLFLIFWGSPRISAAYTARSALLRFRIIHAKRLHRYRLHHLRLKRSVGIICRRLCDRIYDVHTLRHLSERRISAV